MVVLECDLLDDDGDVGLKTVEGTGIYTHLGSPEPQLYLLLQTVGYPGYAVGTDTAPRAWVYCRCSRTHCKSREDSGAGKVEFPKKTQLTS